MSINKRYLAKYDIAYKDLKPIIRPIEFLPGSEYYHIEEWKVISSKYILGVIDNRYKISSIGRVYNIKTDRFIKPSYDCHGYLQINLKKQDGTKCNARIARLIMLHFQFIPNCQYYEVDHIDGIKEHNFLWNLEWVTPQENTYRAINNNLRPISCTVESGTILSNDQAIELYKKAISGNYQISNLAKEYNVDDLYIIRLVQGIIRPYIAKRYKYSSFHYE